MLDSRNNLLVSRLRNNLQYFLTYQGHCEPATSSVESECNDEAI